MLGVLAILNLLFLAVRMYVCILTDYEQDMTNFILYRNEDDKWHPMAWDGSLWMLWTH